MKTKARTRFYLGIIILLSLVGGGIAAFTSAQGPWGYSDPVEYISTAHSILHGQGIGYFEGNGRFTLTTIHPPFYSVAIGLVGLTGMDLVETARWLNVAAFAASIFIAGWIFWRFSRVPALGMLASAILCSFPHAVVMFSSSYSEPLFVLLILAGGLGLIGFLNRENPVLLVLSALVLGMVPYTRYAGIAMLMAGIITFFLRVSGKTSSRLKKTLFFALIGSLPTILWLIRVYALGNHSVGGRGLGADWSTIDTVFQAFRGIFMDTVWLWIPFQKSGAMLRYSARFLLMGLSLIGIILASIFAENRLKKNPETENRKLDSPIFQYFGLSAILYVAVLIATYLFTQPTIDIDNRMLLPLFVCILMGLLGAYTLWQTAWFTKRWRRLQGIPWLVGILCIYWYLPQTKDKIDLFKNGDGWTAYHWRESKTIQAVNMLPEDTPVITNDWELLLLWTERPILNFWNGFPAEQPYQITQYGTLRSDPAQIAFCDQAGVLVIFDDFSTQVRARMDESYIPEIPRLLGGLTVRGTYLDGTIYSCP